MPTFVHPGMLWGLLLVGVPVVIHLINLFRHRRREWAAMEFLLASQKKNQRWVRLRELLLLLARMGVVALVVLMLARPTTGDRWGAWLGGQRVDHVVLLDDSYSMGDRYSTSEGGVEGTVFGVAKRAVARIVEDLKSQPGSQTLTLLRFSRVAGAEGLPEADVLRQSVGGGTEESAAAAAEVESRLAGMEASERAVGPVAALGAVGKLFDGEEDATRIVYLVSDFREKDWAEVEAARGVLEPMAEEGVELVFVNCVERARGNLSVASLAPVGGTMVADVPLGFEVGVTNHAAQAVRDVTAYVEAAGAGRRSVVFDEIGAGETATRRVEIRFRSAGPTTVRANLEEDAVAADNVRHLAMDLPLAIPAVVVDGDAAAVGGGFIAQALSPGGRVKTGIAPQLERPRFLGRESLEKFGAIYLSDVEDLEASAVEALDGYVRRGGAVVVFVGPRTRSAFVNEVLYDEGRGWFPVAVAGTDELPVAGEDVADLEVSTHPMFRVFAGERNSFLASVRVAKYAAVRPDWQPPADGSVKIVARLRNGAPLAVEARVGEGRVMAVLTTAAPEWNNWARNPSFVVAMLELQGALTSERTAPTSQPVGTPLLLDVDAETFGREATMVLPERPTERRALAAGRGEGAARGEGRRIERTLELAEGNDGRLLAEFTETERAGVYVAELTRARGGTEVRQWGVQVEPSEGALAKVSGEELASRMEDLPIRFASAAEFGLEVNRAQFSLSDALLAMLVLIVVGEQALAYLASYHPRNLVGGRTGAEARAAGAMRLAGGGR